MSVENFSNWLEIGKGTADLIIWYAEEDVVLVSNGKSMMDLEPAGPDFDFEWIFCDMKSYYSLTSKTEI